MEFCSNTLVFYLKIGKALVTSTVPRSTLFSNHQQKSTALFTKGLGRYYRKQNKSLQKDGTQVPFYLISEIKKKKIILQPVLQKIKTFSDQISFSDFKNLLFKELKKYTRLPVFSGSFLQMPLLLAGTSMLQYSCLCG